MSSISTWLIAGLGNPGIQYAFTRHNIGFMVIDKILLSLGKPFEKSEFKGQVCRTTWVGQNIITVKPQTYMNLSGECIQAALHFYKIPVENLIVVHDEIDLEFGQLKIQKNRGHGGHNGIRSISAILGTADYIRVRIGIGRPNIPNFSVADYVLQNFSTKEQSELPEKLDRAAEAISKIMEKGFSSAATQYNAN